MPILEMLDPVARELSMTEAIEPKDAREERSETAYEATEERFRKGKEVAASEPRSRTSRSPGVPPESEDELVTSEAVLDLLKYDNCRGTLG